jgi:hypothetical protein
VHLVLGVDLDEGVPFREIELTMAARLLLDLHLWVVPLSPDRASPELEADLS